jgi:hypothetical protein
MGKYLDILQRESGEYDKNDKNDKSRVTGGRAKGIGRLSRFGRSPEQFCQQVFQALERRCPDHVEPDRWQRAVKDGDCFLARWGEQAERLDWTARELFGLHAVPDNPSRNYCRLSRYDETGLIWLLQGRPVVMLTDATATIENPGGAHTVYRKNGRPSFGPVGDTLDDFR